MRDIATTPMRLSTVLLGLVISVALSAVCFALTWAVFMLLSIPANAHTAPTGWDYPVSCCSDYDCREVSNAAVSERPEGYVIEATGEVIPMTSYKVRPSPDGAFHWCSIGGREDGNTICLFVPHRGF